MGVNQSKPQTNQSSSQSQPGQKDFSTILESARVQEGITNKQWKELIENYAYKAVSRDSVFANYRQSSLFQEPEKSQDSPIPSRIAFVQGETLILPKPGSQDNKYSEIPQYAISNIKDSDLQRQIKSTSESPQIHSQIMSISEVFQHYRPYEPEKVNPYQTCYEHFVQFLEDFQEYRYEKNFIQQVEQLCDKSMKRIFNIMKVQPQPRPIRKTSSQIHENHQNNPQTPELYKKLMDLFLLTMKRIQQRVNMELEPLIKQRDENEALIWGLVHDLELQQAVFKSYREKVAVDLQQRQRLIDGCCRKQGKVKLRLFEREQEIKELTSIIQKLASTNENCMKSMDLQQYNLPGSQKTMRKLSCPPNPIIHDTKPNIKTNLVLQKGNKNNKKTNKMNYKSDIEQLYLHITETDPQGDKEKGRRME